MRAFRDHMEKLEEQKAANDAAVRAEAKRKECDIFPEPPPAVYASSSEGFPRYDGEEIPGGGSLSTYGMSRADPTPPCTSFLSNNNSDEELRMRNNRISNPESVSCSNTHEQMNDRQQIQWNKFYNLAGGFTSSYCNQVLMSTDKGLVTSMPKESMPTTAPDPDEMKPPPIKHNIECSGALSTYLNSDANGISPNNGLFGDNRSKILSTSSFSQFFARKSLKGKDVLSKRPEPSAEFPSAIVMQEKNNPAPLSRTATDFLLNQGATFQAPLHCHDGAGPKLSQNEINLREWLCSRGSEINKDHRLHLFRKVVQLVDIAHSQGNVFLDLRPSCLILHSYDDVKYIGSTVQIGCMGLGNQNMMRKRPPELDKHISNSRGTKQQKLHEVQYNSERNYSCGGGSSIEADRLLESDFVRLEKRWYTSPEELDDRVLASSNIYSLGVLLFEVHSAAMLDLHHRVLPSHFLCENPKEAGFCFWLLHPESSARPKAREILQSESISGSKEVHQRNNEPLAVEKEDDPESELLLYFLVSLKEQKDSQKSKLLQSIECLEADIKEVEKSDTLRTSYWRHQGNVDAQHRSHCKDMKSSFLSKSFSIKTFLEETVMKNISQFENAYFCMRSQLQLSETDLKGRSDRDLLRSREKLSRVQTNNEEPSIERNNVNRVGAFFEGICKFARYSKFEECGTLKSGDLLNSTNVICSLSFDREEEYIAAAGVSKKVKIFEFDSLLNESVDIQYPVIEMSNRSKLSCVCWNNYIKNYLASSDYDGVVKMWDASTGQGFSHYMEHQKRTWSVDFSLVDPTKFVSGSDDCSVKLWNINERNSVATIWSPANVCCVQFSAYSTHLLAFGSADYKIYCYDLRHTRIPWCTLVGHGKAVSYVKFLDSETLVSASTDNTLKQWDLNKTSLEGFSDKACSFTFSGHSNEKNFVGLSVLDGYIACGSESNEVYAYYRSLPMPITSYKFESIDPISGDEIIDNSGQFVSSVCWRRKSNMVVAANSTGCIKLLRWSN
nr:protein SUPPRESSOR OF PHYA-105 1-like isoform X1 [Ipomoea batatas]